LADIKDLSGGVTELGKYRRLSLLGLSTYSLLHDINSNLTALKLNLEQLSDETNESKPYLLKSKSSLEKIASLIDWSRSQFQDSDCKALINPNAEVEKLIEINELLLSESKIECSFSGLKNDLEFKTIKCKFSQLLMNLLTNSIEAINRKSEMTKDYDARKISISLVAESDKVLFINFSDNGIGIKRQELQNIYKEFYSSKSDTIHSGLGMHIIHDIVVGNFGGELKVNSNYMEGTTFKILLPAVIE
jgi:signal transduction histidine kinase